MDTHFLFPRHGLTRTGNNGWKMQRHSEMLQLGPSLHIFSRELVYGGPYCWNFFYWDPTKHVVINAMHNLFLNLDKHHCHEILQIDLVGNTKNEESVPVATPVKMVAARKIWAKCVKSKNQLCKIKVPALLALCIENGVILPRPNHRQELLRSQIIDALLNVSYT
jgi:hypothetical protein